MRKQRGFTVIELLIAFVVLVTLTIFFAVQRHDIEAAARDQTRKTAINAMYYNLTEVFYIKNKYYPQTISRDNLTAMDPALFTDPQKPPVTLKGNKCVYTGSDGKTATDGNCNYHYTATDCNGQGQCQKFKLSANMEAEATYIKSSPDKN